MIMKIFNSIDKKTFLLIFMISFVWIVFSDHLVHNSIYKYFDAQIVQSVKGLFYITVLSLLLAYSHRREKDVLISKQEDFSRLFYDSTQAMLIYSANDYKILDVNLSAQQLYRYSKSEFSPLVIFDLAPIEERTRFKETVEDIQTSNDPKFKFKCVHSKKDSETFPVDIYTREIFFGSVPARLMTVVDITELTAAEELSHIQSKMAILGEVSANIGHEIKNPLSIISLTAQKMRKNLERNNAIDTYDKDLQAIEDGVERMNNTVNSLQRISRNEARDEKELIYVSLLVKESVILMRSLFEHMSIRVEVGHLPEVKVLCHQGEMTQVMLNLMKNAYDAMCSQQVLDKVISIESVISQDRVLIKVKNSGPKIDLNIAGQVFRPYFTTKNKKEGTGLGLPLSQKIIQSLGGDLVLDLEDPKTSFIIQLPLQNTSSV